jgi:hypothetical protein
VRAVKGVTCEAGKITPSDMTVAMMIVLRIREGGEGERGGEGVAQCRVSVPRRCPCACACCTSQSTRLLAASVCASTPDSGIKVHPPRASRAGPRPRTQQRPAQYAQTPRVAQLLALGERRKLAGPHGGRRMQMGRAPCPNCASRCPASRDPSALQHPFVHQYPRRPPHLWTARLSSP